MKKEKNPQEEVKKTLAVLDQIGRVKGSPLLYARIQKELKKEKKQATIFTLSTALKAAAVIGLILINIAAFRGNLMNQEQTNSLSEMIAQDYGLSSSSIDPLTNNQ